MRYFLQTKLYEIAFYLEIMVSIILALVLVSASFLLINDSLSLFILGNNNELMLDVFMGKAMTIAVGIEFIKMLCKHTPSTVVEVLLFAIARQIIVDHPSALDTLIGVLAITTLFVVRKYLFAYFDETYRVVLRASQSVKMANRLVGISLPVDDTKPSTLKTLLEETLQAENRTITIGACVYFEDIALRIDNMHDDKITRVEIIKTLH